MLEKSTKPVLEGRQLFRNVHFHTGPASLITLSIEHCTWTKMICSFFTGRKRIVTETNQPKITIFEQYFHLALVTCSLMRHKDIMNGQLDGIIAMYTPQLYSLIISDNQVKKFITLPGLVLKPHPRGEGLVTLIRSIPQASITLTTFWGEFSIHQSHCIKHNLLLQHRKPLATSA